MCDYAIQTNICLYRHHRFQTCSTCCGHSYLFVALGNIDFKHVRRVAGTRSFCLTYQHKEHVRGDYIPPSSGWRVFGEPILSTFAEEDGNLRSTHTYLHLSLMARLAEATSGCTFRCVSVWFACVQGHGTESIAVGAGGHGIARASNVQLRNEILQRRCGCSRLLYCMLQHARFSCKVCKVVHGAPTMLPRHVMAAWGTIL